MDRINSRFYIVEDKIGDLDEKAIRTSMKTSTHKNRGQLQLLNVHTVAEIVGEAMFQDC